MDGYKTLYKGQHVEFSPVKTPRGWQAHELSLACPDHDINILPTSVQPQCTNQLVIRFTENPFLPQIPMKDPKKFAGRREEMNRSASALFNNKNMLIFGPRGIGKSSFAQQLVLLKQGSVEVVQKYSFSAEDFPGECILSDYRCMTGDTLSEIIHGLISTLSINLLGEQLSTTETTSKETMIDDLYSETITESKSNSELASFFALSVQSILSKRQAKVKSLIYLIDEIDVLSPKIELAPFLKATIEKMEFDNLLPFSFILCGVSGAITRLVSEHPSSSRLFESVELKQFEYKEAVELLQLSLQDTDIFIDSDAIDDIINLSNRFPHPAHLLGYHAFEYSDHKKITPTDVDKSKNLIATRLKEQEFSARIRSIQESAEYQVLAAMAKSEDDLVSLQYLSRSVPTFSEHKILGTIGGLREKEYVDREGQKYRFREPLFKIYINFILS